MSESRPKAILFDWDNTLVDTWPTIFEALTKTFEQFDKEPWSFEETKERVHRSLRDSFPDIFGDHWQLAGDAYLDHFKRIHLDRLEPLHGAFDVLESLYPKDIYMAVVSNKTGCNLRAEVEHIGWDRFFSKVVGAKDASEDKPSIQPLLMALDGSGIDLNEGVWLVGDSVTDMECAHNAGCRPVFFGDQDLSHPRFSSYQPSLSVADHQAFHQLVRTL